MARDPNYDILFEPIQIGPKTLKNRFYQVPHCNGAGSERPGTQAGFRGMKAEGGWGGICTEACSIDHQADTSPSTLASLWDEGDVANLRHMCDSLHKWDALAGVELWHMGAAAANLESRVAPSSPSQSTSDWTIACYSHEPDVYEIAELQNMYVEAAKRAVQAGFDIVYVYGSHGVLPVQFLSRFHNKRTDSYGGSFENRARFWIETIEKVKASLNGEAAVCVRFSVDQILGPDGIQAQDEGLKFVEHVTQKGLIDLWDLNLSTYEEWGEDAGPSRFYKTNHQAPFTRGFKDVANVPIINVGRFTNPDDMVEVIRSGQADIIGAARPSIADPFLPRKIEEGRPEDIRECIGCNICISRWERGAALVCTQNPVANEEYRRGWHPEKFDQVQDAGSALVVGAGPAGMECARVLGMRGYQVHLCEAEQEVGGHIRDVVRYPGMSEWGRITSYCKGQLDKLKNVEVHPHTRLSADDILTYGADKVVLCTGSRWATDGFSHVTMGSLPGVDASTPQFATPEQVLAGKEIGHRVVILDADGYFTGVSLAEMMADLGKQVSIVTQFAAAAPLMEYTLEAPNLHRMLHEKKIAQYGGCWVEECEPGDVVKLKLFNLSRDGSKRTTAPKVGMYPRRVGSETELLEADTVILVTARLSNDALYKALRERQDEWQKEGIKGIYQAGDCYAPRLTGDAIFEGHRLAREFESTNPQRPLPYLRERMVWGRENLPKSVS
ncbi:MAG: FAD-dependent oxidoreductase [Pseudomonadales bacterium]